MESGVNDFLRQIPLQLFVMLCGSGILLVFVITVIIGARRARAQSRAAAGAGYAAPPAPSASWSAADADHGDMPDLESLTSSQGMITEPPPVRAAHTGTFNVRETGGDAVDVVEVLTVLRDVADGGLLIQIGDKIYRNPPALADAEFKRRFNTAVSELAKSLSNIPAGRLEDSASTAAVPKSQTGEVEAPPVETSWTGAMPGDLPKFKITETPKPSRPLGRVPKPTETIPEIDVGGSVEAYLQHKLSGTTQFAGRRIHIRPNPLGGIKIEVDGRFYDAVSEVEDGAARAFLKTAIEEWQSRQ